MIEDRHFFAAMEQEAHRARAKFPQQSFWRTLAALTEEVGELNQAYAVLAVHLLFLLVLAVRPAGLFPSGQQARVAQVLG